MVKVGVSKVVVKTVAAVGATLIVKLFTVPPIVVVVNPRLVILPVVRPAAVNSPAVTRSWVLIWFPTPLPDL